MSLAKFAPLHGGLLARKGKAMPATGEIDAEPESAKDISALKAYLSDRIQRLQDDPEAPLKMLTPEPGSHEVPAGIAAAPETEKRVHEAEDIQLAALIVEPEVATERRQLDQGPPLEQPELRASESWDGTERRTIDRRLSAGVAERRKPPVFGKRGVNRTRLSETSQKRTNA